MGFAFTRSEREATEAAAEQRARDDALQSYLDKMSELLVDKNLHGRPDRYDTARVTARARTLPVLRQLGPDGKRTVLLFLREARLINRRGRPRIDERIYPCVVGLEDADLRGANLRNARLIDTRCQEPVSLKGANLVAADLGGANLYRADLRDADLRGADLRGTSFVGANLRQAALDGTNLEGADLRGADLRGADLRGADLRGAEGITAEELEQQAYSIVRAIMPDGSKHP